MNMLNPPTGGGEVPYTPHLQSVPLPPTPLTQLDDVSLVQQEAQRREEHLLTRPQPAVHSKEQLHHLRQIHQK